MSGRPFPWTRPYFDKASGFHGHHRKREDGGLYLFLQACEQGRVKPGSYLLVESLDRLSREQLQEGQALIKRLLFDYRIRLVVLFTQMEYTADNYQQTHWSIDAEFDRAYSESFNKSVRSKDNWERRRRRATENGATLTRKIPTWLRVGPDGKPDRDEAKAAVVSNIFDLAAKGYGFLGIAKKLNAEKVPVFGRGRFWRDSVVEKVLKSRAVLGEYQPRKLVGGKRVVAGAVLQNYFPAVVTVAQWQDAHRAISSRRLARGRISRKVSNLFTHLAHQGGEPLAYGEKDGVGYIQAGKKDTPGIRYDWFERSMLFWLREVRVRLDNSADLGELRVRAEKLERKAKALKAKIDADTDGELGDLLDTYQTTRRDHAALVKEIEAATVPLQSHFLHSQRLAEMLEKATGDEWETLRRELRQAVRLVVDRIDVKVTGDKYGAKRVDVTVLFKDGNRRAFFYETRAGRVVAGGLVVVPGVSLAKLFDETLEDIRDDMNQEVRQGKREPGVCDVRHVVEERLAFPVDADPAEDIKALCKKLRAEKVPYKTIMERTGLDRITIWRYATDYVRPERRKVVHTRP